MDFYETLLDITAFHGKETAKSASEIMVDEFLNSLTERQINERCRLLNSCLSNRKRRLLVSDIQFKINKQRI